MAPITRSTTALLAAASQAVLLVGPARVLAQPKELILTGTCSHEPEDMLEGMRFQMQGRTRTGAPWYKSTEWDQFLYFDPDCSGGGDGEGWIIDDKIPDVQAKRDLDLDGDCNYTARAQWGGTNEPPALYRWFMRCTTGFAYQALRLTPSPQVYPALPTPGPAGCCPLQTTTPWVNNTSRTSYLVALPPLPRPAETKMLMLNGTCSVKNAVNGLMFQLQGRTADGAPFYKAQQAQPFYLYHSASCDVPTAPSAQAWDRAADRWMLDTAPPSQASPTGLVGKTECNYNVARLESAIAVGPPGSSTWTINCGDKLGWVELTLSLQDINVTKPQIIYVSPAAARLRGGGMFLAIAAAFFAQKGFL